MPTYTYECGACEKTFDIRHSIKEKAEECESCKAIGKLTRLPSAPFILKKIDSSSKKAGALVKDFIQETKREVSKEKEDLQKREHE